MLQRMRLLEQRLAQFAGADLQLWSAPCQLQDRSAGLQLLRRVRQWLGYHPQISPRISSARPDHSLTHAGGQGFALALRNSSYRGVGLDFEVWRDLDGRHQRLMLTRRENALVGNASSRDLLRIWTVKEALFKADCNGQQRWVTSYELDQPARRTGTARVVNQGRVRRFRYLSLELPGGILSAAFALGDGSHE